MQTWTTSHQIHLQRWFGCTFKQNFTIVHDSREVVPTINQLAWLVAHVRASAVVTFCSALVSTLGSSGGLEEWYSMFVLYTSVDSSLTRIEMEGYFENVHDYMHVCMSICECAQILIESKCTISTFDHMAIAEKTAWSFDYRCWMPLTAWFHLILVADESTVAY